MSNIHRRIVEISYDKELLQEIIESGGEAEWHRALGRMVAYGMMDANTDSFASFFTTYSTLGLQGVYFHADMDVSKVGVAMSNIYDVARNSPTPLVIGAVLDTNTGKWGFHSRGNYPTLLQNSTPSR